MCNVCNKFSPIYQLEQQLILVKIITLHAPNRLSACENWNKNRNFYKWLIHKWHHWKTSALNWWFKTIPFERLELLWMIFQVALTWYYIEKYFSIMKSYLLILLNWISMEMRGYYMYIILKLFLKKVRLWFSRFCTRFTQLRWT